MKPETQWYLVETLGSARARFPVHDEFDSKQRFLSHFAGVLAGFRYLEAVTQDEEQAWYRKMLIALGYEPPDIVVGVAQSMDTGDPKNRTPTSVAPEQVPKFVRSVPGPDQEFDVYGGRLRVIAVEIYDTGVVVRWRAAPEPDISLVFPAETAALEEDVDGLEEWAAQELRQKGQRMLRMRRLFQFDLSDDVGTEYFRGGGGTRGGGNETTGEVRFLPAPPSAASHLECHLFNVNMRIPLS